MTNRQRPWPTMWLMTDERMGGLLWRGVDQLWGDSGIVFRHHRTDPEAKMAIGRRLAEICKRRDFAFAVAGDEAFARTLGADLVHNPDEPPLILPFSRSVHSIEEAEAAKAEGASLVFVSPVHPTRSHPEAKPLGKPLALRIAKAAGVPAIALGGMDKRKFAGLKRDGFHGWAGIDAFIRT